MTDSARRRASSDRSLDRRAPQAEALALHPSLVAPQLIPPSAGTSLSNDWEDLPRGAAGGDVSTLQAHLAKGDRRPSGTLWRANPREQGLLGLTDAIAWFGAHGYAISLPLIDSQPYDLVVDGRDGLQRVQVKTTTQRSQRGTFIVQLCTRGGNQSFHTTKYFDPDLVELLYVRTDAGERYLIPTYAITARTSLTIGERHAPFRVEPA
jgi:hypothetical protein